MTRCSITTPWNGSSTPCFISLLLVTAAPVSMPALSRRVSIRRCFAILLNPHLDSAEVFVGHLDHMVRPVLYATFLIDRSTLWDMTPPATIC